MNIINYITENFKARGTILEGFTRTNLAELFSELGFKHGAEIGVKAGGYSEILCKSIKDLDLICVDPWVTYKAYCGVTRSKERNNNNFHFCKKLLSPYKVKYIVKPSVEAAREVAKESLDFVYIDANHTFDHVKQDIELWSENVRDGGIVSGHDYHETKFEEVVSAVDECLPIGARLFITDSKIPSWFFIKGE